METAKDLYDAGYDCPPYMVIYEIGHDICKEQHDIMDNGIDISALSSSFAALPRLAEVGLDFSDGLEGQDSTLWLFLTSVGDESYEYHMRILSKAIQTARDKGRTINTISLTGFKLPCYFPCEVPERRTLSESAGTCKAAWAIRLVYPWNK